jgi:ligand-binding sensor domain-containing protein
VGTSAGLFVIDIRDSSRRLHIGAGPQLPSNSVRAIASYGDSVWVGTDAGLSLFQKGAVRVFSARNPRALGAVPLRFIQNISINEAGRVLLATRRGGVGVVTGSNGYAITRRDSLIDNDVFDILERRGRPRLYGCGAGLCAQVDDTTIVSFQAGAGLPRGEVRQVVGDQQAAYVRVARRGIFRFDGMRATPMQAPAGVSFVDATSMSFGADRALWVAGPGWVVVRRNDKWTRVDTPAGDRSLMWRVVMADGAGAFVGSSGGVVLALNRGTVWRVALGGSLPGPAVTSLRPDGRGSAWFVSGGRVVNANAADRRLSVENSPLDAEAVEFSPAGLVVAGRYTVSRRNDAGWTDMTPDVDEADPCFASVFVDRSNMLWVGARSGALYRFDGNIWLRYARPRALESPVRDARAFPTDAWALLGCTPVQSVGGNWNTFAGWDSTGAIVDVAASPSGEWFAATKDRVFRHDPKRDVWQPVGSGAQKSSAWDPPGAITAIAFDATGRLLIGTKDGFGCLVGSKLRWWNAADGIGGERVTDLAVDATTVWVGYGEDGFSAIPLAGLR